MLKWLRTISLGLLSGLILTACWVPAVHAVTSATLDMLGDVAATASGVEVGNIKPLAGQNREAGKLSVSGNPLWSVPLSILRATRERPIFSAFRRPPQPAVVAPLTQASAPAPQKAAEPERPPLALIGAVVGDGDAIAIFLDRTNQKIVRLRQGEAHAGWVLNSIQRRDVTLKKADQTEVLVLQPPEGPAGGAGAPGIPGLAVPASSAAGAYAPFVPRSTPKNGESDGL